MHPAFLLLLNMGASPAAAVAPNAIVTAMASSAPAIRATGQSAQAIGVIAKTTPAITASVTTTA